VVGSRALIDYGRGVVVAAFVTGTAAVALVACSAGTANAPALGTRQPLTPATTPAATPTSPMSVADKAKQEALMAYRGMWQDFAAAGATSDWRSPKLGQYATGVALTNLSRGLYADHYNGLVTKGEPILNPSVFSADPPQNPTKVVITDCGDSTQWLSDGSWRVSDYGVHEIGTC
jgi:hypothetical protein